MSKNRFEIIHQELISFPAGKIAPFMRMKNRGLPAEIIKDKETGVLYLYTTDCFGGAIWFRVQNY